MDPPESKEAAEGVPPPSSAPTAGVGAEAEDASTTPRKSESVCKGSDASSSDEEGNSLHAQRLGIDIPLNPDDEELVFQASRIFKIENLNNFKKLKKLALIANEVTVIEGLEEQGPTLEQLELYQNHIKRIDNIQHLTHLRVLDLSFNNIRRIEHLETLVNLRELFLSSNKITKIEGLSTLKELRTLELGSNRIRVVEGIENLKNLNELWLGRNKITRMELPHLPQLTRVSLQSNRIEEWETDLFKNCPKLRELYLSHNNIPSPPTEIRQLVELTVLDLSCNRIEDVENIASLSQLQDLWLNDNKLATVEKVRCLQQLPALGTLYLERNPLQASLGPGYRQAVTDVLPRISQLDAISIHSSVHIKQNKGDDSQVKPILKR
ncbi:uncharacterized protein EMH_0025340 [Eimeria mitis]|uniref:Protein phosphatase 1 regulatory subunit 7 n=1 Tax=Eimeria mitis TaxID=44415 RepID=U6KGH3_9EIME|nr:uncharacterized protein EMH_0025340 [Eimeria mitis]CDJ35327.1 hypothetical protein, conserved [Eimeria mitis]